MSRPAEDSGLSPRLAELARPEVRSAPPAEQAKRLGVAVDGPGSLLRDGGRVIADVSFAGGALSALDELRAAGAEILAPSRRYQTVTVAIAPARLRELAAVPGVEGVSENRVPLVFAGGGSAATAGVGAECEGGSIVSEGVAQLQVATARSKYGVGGSGVTVGVLSDSYDQASQAADESGPIATHASEDVQSSDLPGPSNPCAGEKTPVNVLEDFPGPLASDEGRGMLQIAHDVAPGAGLAFATAFVSEFSFAQNIEKLAKPVAEAGAEADVIVDDVVWFEEPFFQDGPVAVAVSKVVADGVPYFSSAGNNNLFEGINEIASWEAPEFRDAGSCPPSVLAFAGIASGHCLDFNSDAPADTTFGITVSPGATLTLDLQWAQPWFGVETDLDAYLLDAGGNVIAAEENNNLSPAFQRPVELPQWENNSASAKTVRLVVNRCAAECNPAASATETPTVKFALLQNGSGVTQTEYPQSSGGDTVGPTIFGHAGSSSAVAVAAVPFSDSAQVEKYSSRGPVVHHFGPVTSTTPAAPLPSPETIAKPDIAATDCGATTFFSFLAGDGEWRFCGTSAAAPHAAGVAALQLDVEPTPTVEEVREAQTSTADPVGSFEPKAVGAGLLDADSAIASLLPPAVITVTKHPGSRTADATPSFGFEASAGTEFTCAIDGGLAEPCDPEPSLYTAPSLLPDGPHVFEVVGVDVVGSASFSFTVDTTPPAITVTERPPAISANPNPTFAFSASEPAAFACALDSAAAQPCKSPFSSAALPDGSHALLITATDQVGNSSQSVVEFSTDTAPPVVSLAAFPAAKSADARPVFAFGANEPASFACAIDGASQPCASPFAAPTPLADGSHAFEVLAADLAGNVGRATGTFAVDTRRPQTRIAKRPPRTLRTRLGTASASFGFAANEPGVSFVCKVDRGLLRFCPAHLSRRFAPGLHTIRVKARDEVGNVDRTPAVFRFRVERIG
jgi:Subtilase family